MRRPALTGWSATARRQAPEVRVGTIVTLLPGDRIATGTPGGLGHARTPPIHLTDGTTVVTTGEGVGTCTNHCRAESRDQAEP